MIIFHIHVVGILRLCRNAAAARRENMADLRPCSHNNNRARACVFISSKWRRRGGDILFSSLRHHKSTLIYFLNHFELNVQSKKQQQNKTAWHWDNRALILISFKINGIFILLIE